MDRTFYGVATFVLLIAVGCEPRAPTPLPREAVAPAASNSSLSQTVLVIDDLPLAASIGLLRGEWNAYSGNTLAVRTATLAEVLNADKLDADVVCYPARHLGELATRQWLRPLRASLLESPTLGADDFLPLCRHREMIYDGVAYATPLGCQTTLLGVPQSLVDAWGAPPETYEQLLRGLDGAAEAVIYGSPVDHPFCAAELLLAAAASLGAGDSLDPLLFDAETMEPTIETEAFVRGIDKAARLVRRLQPTELAAGEGASLVWMRLPAAIDGGAGQAPSARTSSVAENLVTVLCLGSRQANVTRETRNTAAAFGLLAWLASGDQVAQIVQKHESLIACRQSLLPATPAVQGRPPAWTTDRALLAAAALEEDRSVRVPRIPGIDEYLSALSEAVEHVATEQRESAAALAEAAAAWEAITERRVSDMQRAAYLRHLELP